MDDSGSGRLSDPNNPHGLLHNRLLAALSPAEFERLRPGLESVELARGSVLHECGGALRHAWFPTTAVVLLLSVMRSGASAEVAFVGSEGMIGLALVMGGDTASNRAVVQGAGQLWRLERGLLVREFERGGALQRLMLRYAHALLVQVAQTAACNRHHTVEQQLCRWLLASLDRTPSGKLVATQELIASMLGVRREGVTEAAGRLQRAGLIAYRRGRIWVPDRGRLEAHACECYDVGRRAFSQLHAGQP